MVFLVTSDNMMMEPNIGYYGKEVFLATHSSYILPKDSPLEVLRVDSKQTNRVIALEKMKLYFPGLVQGTNYVVAKHRIVRQVLHR